jgi:hypothetical protein
MIEPQALAHGLESPEVHTAQPVVRAKISPQVAGRPWARVKQSPMLEQPWGLRLMSHWKKPQRIPDGKYTSMRFTSPAENVVVISSWSLRSSA